ncbi:MAG: ATP-dependent DNA ligase [Thaumarchaeota archaeon]|nr:ATP-dependent DNA ligase [Nitrososphaerota archaeon]MCY3975525.1 ATP-dependent DNA ligase [Nitrososphaerota archaeon]
MKYINLAIAFENMEKTSSRLKLTGILVELFKKTNLQMISKIIYLIQGKIRPNFSGVEIGIAEKLAMKSISKSTATSIRTINKLYNKIGDLGDVTHDVLIKKTQTTFFNEIVTVERVFNTFCRISNLSGAGSQNMKMKYISSLLNDSNPLEGKFIIKILLGTLRLGIADNTVMDALSLAYTNSKKNRKLLENAYNVSSDLGKVAQCIAEHGLEGLDAFKITVFSPIRPMLADRIKNVDDIFIKTKSIVAEYKLDGERAQIHLKNNQCIIFSRSLENITKYYPDVCKKIINKIKVHSAILEAEIVAINETSGEYLPFQELMHRRRKHKIENAILAYPITVNFFDILYLNGENYVNHNYTTRRRKLIKLIDEDDFVKLVRMELVKNSIEVENFLEHSINSGCEGIMLKKIESKYKAGIRGGNWLKLKPEYQNNLGDSLDLIVIGAFFGKGRRTGKYGTVLLSTYDDETDTFPTICKVGSGFTDENLDQFYQALSNKIIKKKNYRIKSKIKADVWFEPEVVIEIIASEITLSPIHRTAYDMIKKDHGLALRFPKFTGKIRLDKIPEAATTQNEIINIYNNQKKKI